MAEKKNGPTFTIATGQVKSNIVHFGRFVPRKLVIVPMAKPGGGWPATMPHRYICVSADGVNFKRLRIDWDTASGVEAQVECATELDDICWDAMFIGEDPEDGGGSAAEIDIVYTTSVIY